MRASNTGSGDVVMTIAANVGCQSIGITSDSVGYAFGSFTLQRFAPQLKQYNLQLRDRQVTFIHEAMSTEEAARDIKRATILHVAESVWKANPKWLGDAILKLRSCAYKTVMGTTTIVTNANATHNRDENS